MKKLIQFFVVLLFLKIPVAVVAQEGCLEGNCVNGTGYLVSVADSYSGSFVNGLRQGQGKQTYIQRGNDQLNGSTYEGNWVKDKRDGQGKFTFRDGRIFIGIFSKNIGVGKIKINRILIPGTLTAEDEFIEDRTIFFTMVKKLQACFTRIEDKSLLIGTGFMIGKGRIASLAKVLSGKPVSVTINGVSIKAPLKHLYMDTATLLHIYQVQAILPVGYDTLTIATSIPDIYDTKVFTLNGDTKKLYEARFREAVILNGEGIFYISELDSPARVAGSVLFDEHGKILGLFKERINQISLFDHLLEERRTKILSAGR